MRTPVMLLAAIGLLLSVAACSDNTTGVKSVPPANKSDVMAVSGTLDQNVVAILALFPNGLANAATARWDNVKRKYAAGLSDPSQMTVAKQMLFELSDWVNQKTQEMNAPPDNEPKTGAAARAILYMSMYVYGGPETSPPPFTPSADVVVGLVTPGAPATIVTPTKHAGVQLEAGSVAENTIVVITQNPTPYPANCSGPLQTRLCQYPQFYTFDEFPHKRLLKPAKFNVCHVNSGDLRRPLADHDRFRLAHAKPTDPADYTPGSTIRDQNGENVELLPLIAQTFSTCVGNFYAKNTALGGPLGLFSRFARGVQNIITPRTAYAIDLGLGGLSVSFSPFNDVDPLGLPDFAVQSFGAGESPVSAGGHLSVTYSVKNIGTATGAEVPFVINLVQPVVEGTPIEVQIGAGSIPSLPPGATITQTNSDAVVPASLAPGTYSIRFVVGSDPIFPDADLTNNTGASPIIVPRPSLIRVCARTITTTPQTVPTLSLAMQYVGEGGTVRICDGVYSVFDVGLNAKSLTIEGEGPGLPTLEVGDHNGVFFMNSPTPISTVVTLRKLRFHGGTSSNVTVAGHYGALLIDQVEFHPPSGAFGNSPSGLGVYLATGNGVTVQNSTFIGGARGVHEFNSTNVVVVNNSFSGQSDWAIIGDTGSVGDFTAIGNTITHVPYGVGIFRTGGPGTYKILNNSISVDLSEQSWTAIAVQHGTAEIRGNTITGVGGNLDPATRSSWPLRDGIWVSDSSSATISNNALSSAYVGFNISNGSNVHGRDNIVTNVSQGLQVFNTNTVAITRSDFSNYTTALITDSASGIAVCNWWGSTEGPQGIAPWYSTAIYAPWSTSPIANEPTVTCGSIP